MITFASLYSYCGRRLSPILKRSHFFCTTPHFQNPFPDTPHAAAEELQGEWPGSNSPSMHWHWPHTLPVRPAWKDIAAHATGSVSSPCQAHVDSTGRYSLVVVDKLPSSPLWPQAFRLPSQKDAWGAAFPHLTTWSRCSRDDVSLLWSRWCPPWDTPWRACWGWP